MRLAVDVPTAGVLAVDAHHVGDAHLTALYLSQRAYARCPLPAEAADHAAAETTPSRTGYVSLAACAEEPGRRWYVYAAGPVTGFATFNVSARVGAELAREPLTPAQMVEARGVFEVDGNSNSWEGTFWKLYSNSVMLKVDGEWEQW